MDKKLVMMIGLPRSGKSSHTKLLSKEYIRVSADDLRYRVYGQRFWNEGEPMVWHTRGIILKMLMEQGQNIIIDETNTTVRRRADIIKLAKKHGYKVTGIWIDTPKELCIQRLANGDVPFDEIDNLEVVINRMDNQFEPPSGEEGFDHILIPMEEKVI